MEKMNVQNLGEAVSSLGKFVDATQSKSKTGINQKTKRHHCSLSLGSSVTTAIYTTKQAVPDPLSNPNFQGEVTGCATASLGAWVASTKTGYTYMASVTLTSIDSGPWPVGIPKYGTLQVSIGTASAILSIEYQGGMENYIFDPGAVILTKG